MYKDHSVFMTAFDKDVLVFHWKHLIVYSKYSPSEHISIVTSTKKKNKKNFISREVSHFCQVEPNVFYFIPVHMIIPKAVTYFTQQSKAFLP